MQDPPSHNASAVFSRLHAGFGFDPNEDSLGGSRISERNGELTLSSMPEESDFPPKLLPVGSVARLRQLWSLGMEEQRPVFERLPGGIAAGRGGEELRAMVEDAVNLCGLNRELTDLQKSHLRQAVRGYLLGLLEIEGDLKMVVNTFLFPGCVAVYSSPQVLTVGPGRPLVLAGDDPVFLNVRGIVLEPEGEIVIETQANLMTGHLDSANGRGRIRLGRDADLQIRCSSAGGMTKVDLPGNEAAAFVAMVEHPLEEGSGFKVDSETG